MHLMLRSSAWIAITSCRARLATQAGALSTSKRFLRRKKLPEVIDRTTGQVQADRVVHYLEFVGTRYLTRYTCSVGAYKAYLRRKASAVEYASKPFPTNVQGEVDALIEEVRLRNMVLS